MQINEKGKKILVCIFYVLSLLPLFLPWCYFEEEVDGIKSGLDIVNHAALLILIFATLLGVLLARNERGRKLTKILLLTHSAIYLFYALFWYVPLLTDFNLEKFLLCHMAQDVRRVNKRDFGGFDVLLKALFFLHI